jgi:hypothetical protein
MKKISDFKLPFYQMFVAENELDMDDMREMWEALLIRHSIKLPEGWDAFIDNVNNMANEIEWKFNETFDKYLITL